MIGIRFTEFDELAVGDIFLDLATYDFMIKISNTREGMYGNAIVVGGENTEGPYLCYAPNTLCCLNVQFSKGVASHVEEIPEWVKGFGNIDKMSLPPKKAERKHTSTSLCEEVLEKWESC